MNTRTLTIASVASASAAAVTSQLWIAGTWIAAALTPVLVALLSEAMHRPTERIARAWTSERDVRPSAAQTATREEPSAVSGTAGPVRVYRQTSRGVHVSGRAAGATGSGAQATGRAAGGRISTSRGADPVNGGAARTSLSRPTTLSRRRIAIGTVAATAAIAFVVGIVALTTVDLVSGGSVGKGSGRSTLFSGSGNGSDAKKDTQESGGQDQQQRQQQDEQQQQAPDSQQTDPSDEPTTTDPAPDEQPPSDTSPVPPPPGTPPSEPVPQSTP